MLLWNTFFYTYTSSPKILLLSWNIHNYTHVCNISFQSRSIRILFFNTFRICIVHFTQANNAAERILYKMDSILFEEHIFSWIVMQHSFISRKWRKIFKKIKIKVRFIRIVYLFSPFLFKDIIFFPFSYNKWTSFWREKEKFLTLILLEYIYKLFTSIILRKFIFQIIYPLIHIS